MHGLHFYSFPYLVWSNTRNRKYKEDNIFGLFLETRSYDPVPERAPQ